MRPEQYMKDATTMAVVVASFIVGVMLFQAHVLNREDPLPIGVAVGFVVLALVAISIPLAGIARVVEWRAGQVERWWRNRPR